MTDKKWQKSSPKLVDAFYEAMKSFPEADLRKMFGYPCAFVNGNMMVGLHEENLAVRLNPQDRELAFKNNEGEIFAPMKGRVMREYVALNQDIIFDTKKLKKYIKKGVAFVATLPPKK